MKHVVLTSEVFKLPDLWAFFAAALPASPFVTGSGSNFSSPIDVAQANAALHGHGRVLIDNLAYAPFGTAAETIITSPAPMQPQDTLGQSYPPFRELCCRSSSMRSYTLCSPKRVSHSVSGWTPSSLRHKVGYHTSEGGGCLLPAGDALSAAP